MYIWKLILQQFLKSVILNTKGEELANGEDLNKREQKNSEVFTNQKQEIDREGKVAYSLACSPFESALTGKETKPCKIFNNVNIFMLKR